MQAADTTGGLTGEFNVAISGTDTSNLFYAKTTKDQKIFSDSALTQDTGQTTQGDLIAGFGAFYAVLGVAMTNGTVTAYHIAPSTLASDLGWIKASDVTTFGSVSGGLFSASTSDQTFTLSAPTTAYLNDGSSSLSITALVLDGTTKNIKSVTGTDDLVIPNLLMLARLPQLSLISY
ncbi:hypothetical protein JCM14202_3940 [Agrilactobacillus composti DSM 18527 = JCM 14202]|uniref:hypothetical protein n=1 Tax=Agrilactobacillus composti TaxID=398555 RepID=UPI00042E0DB6|nr:hypothetical protein [Agrilactobacillus composti]GAF41963.1 hypothetical protein JCM14202_3940 [Agrilactobacillus composti DSM 18527 = JCM 14202]